MTRSRREADWIHTGDASAASGLNQLEATEANFNLQWEPESAGSWFLSNRSPAGSAFGWFWRTWTRRPAKIGFLKVLKLVGLPDRPIRLSGLKRGNHHSKPFSGFRLLSSFSLQRQLEVAPKIPKGIVGNAGIPPLKTKKIYFPAVGTLIQYHDIKYCDISDILLILKRNELILIYRVFFLLFEWNY